MRILLIDDHTLFRDALAEVLRQLGDEVTTFNCGNADEAKAAAAYYQDLDLVLMDLFLPGSEGMSLLTELRDLLICVPIVVLSASEQPHDVRAALDCGAAGYIPKTSCGHELLSALKQVLTGEIYVPTSLLAAMQSDDATTASDAVSESGINEKLTGRQLEVLNLLAQGLPNKSIASRLGLSEGTVKLHVSAVMRAVGARNRTEAVMAAERLGLLH